MVSETVDVQMKRVSPVYLALALALQLIMTALIVVYVGIFNWDDGAITLAYSRTFAETGRVALTAASEQVEGFSSVSWFLVNAMVAVFHPGFEEAILFSQLLASVFLALAVLLTFLIARELDLRESTTAAILIIFSVFGPSISEISNGMEMTLMASSCLAIVYFLYFRENWPLLLFSTVIFLSTRFEAMIYYAVLLVPLAFRQQFSRVILLSTFGLAVVGVLEGVRYFVFGDVLPNTIYAKMHPPYSKPGISLVYSRLKASFEIVRTVAPLTLAVLALAISEQNQRLVRNLALGNRLNNIIIVSAPIIAAEAFSVLVGTVWGYIGRVQFFSFPFVLLLFGILFDFFVEIRRISFSKFMLIVVSAATILASWRLSASDPLSQLTTTIMSSGSNNIERFGVTPASYRITGLAVDKVRNLVGLQTIVFATPDVGGLALCCSRIRVLDIGLLTNRLLAKGGYNTVPVVFADEKPDIIEVHEEWATYSQIYNLPVFKENYEAILIDGTRLYLRRDHVQELLEDKLANWCYIKDISCLTMALETHRYVDHTFRSDDVAFLVNGRVLVVKSLPEIAHR